MGIATIMTAALKHISWGKVANMALQYGPDLVRTLKARQSAAVMEAEAHDDADVLVERFQEVETVLIQQNELLKRQNERVLHLEELARTLQARLNLATVISIIALVLAVAGYFWR